MGQGAPLETVKMIETEVAMQCHPELPDVFYHRVIKMVEVGLLGTRHPLIQQPHHCLRLEGLDLDHEVHGVGPCLHQGQQRMILVSCHLKYQKLEKFIWRREKCRDDLSYSLWPSVISCKCAPGKTMKKEKSP